MSNNTKLRRFVFTCNNYTPAIVERIDQVLTERSRYAIYGKETGEEGTPHLQGYVSLKGTIRFNTLRTLLPGCHIEAAKGNEQQNYDYCSKDGDFKEFGERSKQGNRTDLSSAIETLKQGGIKKVVEEHPEEYVKFSNGLHKLLLQLNATPYTHHDVRGVWIYGEPGTGKSHSARAYDPELYNKAQNKWWDGYNGEHTVLIDDFDTSGVCLGHYLKIWADKYACTGEFKGGTCHLHHRTLIITSNYHPNQLFEDPILCAAIERRFKIRRKETKEQQFDSDWNELEYDAMHPGFNLPEENTVGN